MIEISIIFDFYWFIINENNYNYIGNIYYSNSVCIIKFVLFVQITNGDKKNKIKNKKLNKIKLN